MPSKKPSKKRSPAVRQSRTVALSTQAELLVPVRESLRARRPRVVAGNTRSGEIELVVPQGTSERSIDRFLAQHQGWIEQTVLSQRARRQLLGLSRPGVVWRLGEPIPVVRLPGVRAEARLGTVASGLTLGVAGEGVEAVQAVEHWLREEARLVLGMLCAREARAMNVAFTRIRIGSQRTNWGSRSCSGTLSFNWRLLLCPLAVIDYVVVHELCHILQHNHSPLFWAEVTKHRPDYKRQVEWFARHDLEVRFWTPADALRRA